MQESIHTFFQIGTIQWMTHPPKDYDLMDSIKQIACDDFFDAIEVTHIADETVRKAAATLLETSHLKVCFGAQPILLSNKLNPNDLDEERRAAAEAALCGALTEAKELGAKGIAFLAGKWTEETREQCYQKLLKTTVNVCRFAKTLDMYVEMEVFDFDMDKAALIGPAPLAMKFAADVRTYCNNFGLLVDLSHFPTTYETTKFVVQVLRPYITHFHVGNAVVKEGFDAYGDKHPRFGFPNSANDVEELTDFFRVLKDEGFLVKDNPYVLSFEVTPFGDEDGQIILGNCKRVINRAWALA